MATNPIEQVLKTIRSYDMLKRGDTVLAAVSGGPDSVFLLYALNRLKGKLGIKKLAVCSLDHGLRGKESRRDSLFVKRLAKEFGMEFIHKKIKLKKVKGLSTEEAAREERYKFFRGAAAKCGANVIATGHTLDDHAETVLMRLIKGASLKGIIGISPVRREARLAFVRPLIELEKGRIERFLNEKGIGYRIDLTNLEPIYFRNVVRRDIIPFLEKYNPRLKKAILSLAGHLREDFDFIAAAKKNAVRRTPYAVRSTGDVEIKLKDIVIQPKALQKEILRDSLEKAGGVVKRLSFRHWKEMEVLLRDKRKGSSVCLPGGIRVTRRDPLLIFSRI